MSREQLERLMLDTLKEIRLADPYEEYFQVDDRHLDTVFPDFFSLLYQTVATHTVTVNEYAYLATFLFEHYMKPVYDTAK